MVEKLKNDFQDWCNKAIKESRDFTNPDPILEFTQEVSLWGKDALPFLKQIEDKLINKGFVTTEINCWDDFLKYKSKYTFAATIQYRIASIIKIHGK